MQPRPAHSPRAQLRTAATVFASYGLFVLNSFALSRSVIYCAPIISPSLPRPLPLPLVFLFISVSPLPVHPLQLQAVGGCAPVGGRRAGRCHRRLFPWPGRRRGLRLVSPLKPAVAAAAAALGFTLGSFGRGRATASALRSPRDGLRGDPKVTRQKTGSVIGNFSAGSSDLAASTPSASMFLFRADRRQQVCKNKNCYRWGGLLKARPLKVLSPRPPFRIAPHRLV